MVEYNGVIDEQIPLNSIGKYGVGFVVHDKYLSSQTHEASQLVA